MGLAKPLACHATSISKTTGTSIAWTWQPCLCLAIQEYRTPGSKNSSEMSTRSLRLWLMSESDGFLGLGTTTARNMFLGQCHIWGGRLSKISQMAVDETVCLASFIWYGLKPSIENENARHISLAGPGRNHSPFFRRILHKCPASHMSSMYSLWGLQKALNMYSSMLGLESSCPNHCFKSCILYLHRGTVHALQLNPKQGAPCDHFSEQAGSERVLW